ncbi:putative DNA modification/repair radical SAM protein [Miniphocaeibacter massiliensis]|uniref:putative DNA modification/repair radical SAM protein n=1 Tax=Miniphocaeibacter massiliensis TaxID=2041841 RepID=UPI001A9166DE|nr:putative DNA modification/repair radical SAM protein [Miniphocaeibacter massiliensis]
MTNLAEKLKILTDAAKYDVSCSSSGSNRKNNINGLGNTSVSGICHSWSDDGRCISLLKILMTNNCIYDCDYCINRFTNDIKREIFSVDEIVNLTINFYKRNYIEGLFLSSGIYKSPDYTMELLISIAKKLREIEKFNGYIHMKAIPGSSKELIHELGKYIDRVSVNIELPSEKSLKLYAPQKKYSNILKPMNIIKDKIIEIADDKKFFRNTPNFINAGQTTQMIIGAGKETDYEIIKKSENLYNSLNMKRVYYSAFVPVSSSKLLATIKEPPLRREHRIYQADFLLRFYNYKSYEILNDNNPNFDMNLDPKANWALNNFHLFPIEINKASYYELLRIPGLGPTSAKRIVSYRNLSNLTYDNLKKIGVVLKRAKYFITVNGEYRGLKNENNTRVREMLSISDRSNIQQLSYLS